MFAGSATVYISVCVLVRNASDQCSVRHYVISSVLVLVESDGGGLAPTGRIKKVVFTPSQSLCSFLISSQTRRKCFILQDAILGECVRSILSSMC